MQFGIGAGHAIAIELGDDWFVAPGWDRAVVQESRGVVVMSAALGVQLHLRSFTSGAPFHFERDLIGTLHAQAWASPPRHLVVRRLGHLEIASAIYDMPERESVVVEAFVTDGVRLANAATPCTRDRGEVVRTEVERLLARLEFRAV